MYSSKEFFICELFLSTSCAVIVFIFQNAFSFCQSCFCCTCCLSMPGISGFTSKVVKVHLVMSSYLSVFESSWYYQGRTVRLGNSSGCHRDWLPGENETLSIVRMNPQIRKPVSLYSAMREGYDRVWSNCPDRKP